MEPLLIFAAMVMGVIAKLSKVFHETQLRFMEMARPRAIILWVLMPATQILLVAIGFYYFEWWIWIGVLLVAYTLFGTVVLLETGPGIFWAASTLRVLLIAATASAWLIHLGIL